MTATRRSVTGVSRRKFLGWVVAGPTLIVAAPLLAGADEAGAAVPSPPELSDLIDLTDVITDASIPTARLVTVTVNVDGSVSYAMPRAEVGQGITTAVSMIIADELDVAIEDVRVTLSDARPELIWNQFTGSSTSLHSLYHPLRTAAAIARTRLVAAAAEKWNVDPSTLTTSNGTVRGPGRSIGYGSLAAMAAARETVPAEVTLKDAAAQTVVGVSQRRVDALAAVTGRKTFAMDLQVPGALPAMVCRAPMINGKVASVANLAAVRAMPGVTDVGVMSSGVAVRARTFGQCIDAVRALRVSWTGGTVNGESDATVLAKLRKAEIPLLVPKLPLGTRTFDGSFTFYFRSNSPLETNCAVADVRPDSAEIWSSLKNPILTKQTIAQRLGLPQKKVTVHVVEGGGSFGRHLFSDAAYEAAEISKLFGKPVRLMWHRTDDFRHGRTHPMATSRVRATVLAGNVLTFEQRHTSVATDVSHVLGEMISAAAGKFPVLGDLTIAEGIFMLTQNTPYNFGLTTQLLNEIYRYDDFHTGSMRNIYSPDVRTAQELMADVIAKAVGKNPFTFRRAFVKDARLKAVLLNLGQVGRWGRFMVPGTAQGIALHSEYKSRIGALVEIDCRPVTVNRTVQEGYTGPRVTKVVIVVDVGLTVNPEGLVAQMQGGAMDGIAQTLSSSLHLENGIFKEGSWDHYHYTRQWNVPPQVQVVIMPNSTTTPGGAGELGVGVVQAAVACAYARATGRMPTEFPINHNQPLDFTPLPLVPPIPQSPTDGLAHAL
jgi:isoquinoline 1-oxidoreductase beta subunit